MPETTEPEDLIDPVYLPFTPAKLNEHFAPVAGGGDPERHLAYYLTSKRNRAEFKDREMAGASSMDSRAIRLGRQMQKDERFWVVAALMGLYHAPDRTAALSQVLAKCLGDQPPFEGLATWEEALGDRQELFFEVNLPSPPSYRKYLKGHLDERMVAIPSLREEASTRGERLEGATKVDAVLIAPETGFAVLFEAKVLADISCGISFDVLRNQMARNIDVMLDANPRLSDPMRRRVPERTCFVLLTPEKFHQNKESRLYGWLYNEYTRQDSTLLNQQLPHRSAEDLATVPLRLGWLTWEDCNAVQSDACRWLAGATA